MAYLPCVTFPMENAPPSPSCPGRRKGNNAHLETSSPCYWTHMFKAISLELWAPKSLMPLSPKQKDEVLRDELSAHRCSPHHWEEGVQEPQTCKPQVLKLFPPSVPPYHIVVPGKHPPATLQRCQPGVSSPRFHSRGGKPCGGDRGF